MGGQRGVGWKWRWGTKACSRSGCSRCVIAGQPSVEQQHGAIACPLGVIVVTPALAAPERLPPCTCLPSLSFLPFQFAFNTLQRVSPVSHGVCNVVKRIAIIFSSVFFFHQVRAQPQSRGSGFLSGMQAWRDRCRGLGERLGLIPACRLPPKARRGRAGGLWGRRRVGWGGGGTQGFGWRLCMSFVSHLSPGHVRYGRG